MEPSLDSSANGERLPVFVMMTCLNGYFDDPALDSLGEALLKGGNGGAVAVWASSGMTRPEEQALMNQQLYRLLFGASRQSLQALRIGEATAEQRQSSVMQISDGRGSSWAIRRCV